MVAIGCQDTGWREFVDGAFFSGPVFVDKEKAAFKALGLRRSGLWDGYGFADWSSWSAVFRSYRRGIAGDLKGDGFQMGGTFVILPSGVCVYDHRMQSPGDKPDANEVLAAVTAALHTEKPGPARQ
jgi:prostamide/prostaglandin F2alpha synthase